MLYAISNLGNRFTSVGQDPKTRGTTQIVLDEVEGLWGEDRLTLLGEGLGDSYLCHGRTSNDVLPALVHPALAGRKGLSVTNKWSHKVARK